MANFGKRAKLDSQKSTVKVECIVSVYDKVYDENGNVERYKIVVQRLQDTVSEEDALNGLADALPYIVNRKQWYYDENGDGHAIYSHHEYILPEAMQAIIDASQNCIKTVVKIENTDGTVCEKEIENYCVKVDIGFNLAKGEAFFYRIKTGVTKDSLEKDIKYNLRHMPQAGRKLTKDIIENHKHITDIAYQVYQKSLTLGEEA